MAAIAAALPLPAFAEALAPGPRPGFTTAIPAAAACTPAERPVTRGTKLFRFPHTGETSTREVYSATAALSWSIDGAPDITAMSRTIASVLEFNAVRFDQVDPGFVSFVPGELYEEVYGRDLFTTSLAAQYLYGESFLRNGVEQFLKHQFTAVARNAEFSKNPYPGPGALPGYITHLGRGEKTTSVADEEGSIIQLAHLYYTTRGGPAWLACTMDGLPVIDRLNQAADMLVQGRVHPATGLMKRSHTTDWGDVRMQGGTLPTVADPVNETWTASIYDQAWNYRALRQLAEMNRAAGQPQTADRWDQAANRIKEATNRLLWMPDRGYYRIHLHLTPFQHEDFDEDAIVAIGNAVAVYAGLTDPQQTRSVLAAVERGRVRAGSLKPGLSLDPPYLNGVFRHDILYNSGRYQNGGQWDWWGGVQMTGEFEAGYSELGWQHLAAMAKDWATHPNDIAEWQVPTTNSMEGSHHYTGAAGTVSESVVRGAFGVQLTNDGFQIRPRLGDRNGYLQIMQPATGRTLWFRQRLVGDNLIAQYSVTHEKSGRLAVMLPPGASAATATLDGVERPVTLRIVGQDRFADLGTVPAGAHTAQVRLSRYTDTPIGVTWLASEVPGVVPPDAPVNAQLRVLNTGATGWPRLGDGRVQLAYRWVPRAGGVQGPVATGVVTLPRTIDGAQASDIPVGLAAPNQPGDYRLQFDLFTDGATPFRQADNGPQVLDIPVTVSPPANGGLVEPWSNSWLGRAGTAVNLGFTVRNTGVTAWGASGRLSLVASWTTTDGRPYLDGAVQPQDVTLQPVLPGRSAYAPIGLVAPRRAGLYRVSVQVFDGGQPVQLAGLPVFEVSVVP